MQLKVINSNSAGNAYILENENEALLIECGVRFDMIKKALNFNLRKVVGCLISHEHNDHCKSVSDVMKFGVDVYASEGTHIAMNTGNHHRANKLVQGNAVTIGGFHVIGFDVEHDVKEPMGFLILHAETGKILFLTDSYYCRYKFNDLTNIIIEANYCQSILDERLERGDNPQFLRDRVITSHMSLATCKQMLQANDLSKVNNIVLIHLSDGNSDEKRFKKEVEEATGKQVHIARPGLTIPFNKTPF